MLNATIRNCIGVTSGTNGATSGASGTASGSNTDKDTAQTDISKNELLVYHFVKANPEASTRMIAGNTKLSARTVQRCIAALVEKRIIENQGTRQHVKWTILEQRR